ncbi:MFS general substrate transporter [Cutaneotrichosporon oleaginosum]|uniref:MFS general substrate transporter n=1 Tax=Cutaneotrichosporon oleaginosum TaxID=879819 RepID=A0A0J1B104_9TREE|nr:MFS general substrate transporter [Cutaneotrichosporon oleaginosum]KLT41284.1 MFS general substrate transporter [Cutaneotrichosporon oleaginosum]TXT14034.1 hypothetical protein COLE_00227 [Cutaneotrichosporon oleaginosum]
MTPETPADSDLQYIRSLSPRLRTSEDSALAEVLEHPAAHPPEPAEPAEKTNSESVDAAPSLLGPPPDGGLRAWLVVIGSAFAIFCVLGLVTGAGQFQAYYLAHQLKGYSPSTVAWLASIQITLTFGGAVVSGALFDAYSAQPLVMLSTLGQFGSLVALAFSTRYVHFLLSHAAFGVSAAIVYSPATGIAAHWFLRRRGTAVAVIMSGAGAGGVVYPILIKNLTDRFAWRDAILILAGIHFALMLPGCLFMKKRLPNRPPVPLRALARPWKDFRYCFLIVGQSLTSLAVFSPYFNAALYARANNASPTVVGYAVAILQAGNFVGRMASGPLADALGTWRVFVAFALLSAVTLFAFFVAPMGTAGTVAGLAIYGAVSGGHVTLIPAVTASISPAHEIGMRLGLLWTVLAASMLVGPVISGELVAAGGGLYKWAGLWNALQFCLSSAVLSVPGIVMWRRRRRGEA